MPHICIVSTVHDPFDTRVFHLEARTLAQAGYRVTLLAQGAPDELRDGVRFIHLPPRQFSLTARVRNLFRAWREARRIRADAYHVHDPELTTVGLLLKLAGRRVVYDVHEHVPHQIRQKQYIPRRLRGIIAALYDVWERLVTRAFDVVIIALPGIGRRFPEGKTILILNRPIIADFQLADPGKPAPDGTVIAIYNGLIEKGRGLLIAARALRRIPAGIPLRLVVVGPCPFPDFLQELREAGDERLCVKPPVPFDQIPGLLAGAQIGIDVAPPTDQYLLSHPRKVFEFMAAGLPAVISDFPVWREQTAGCVPVDSTDAGAVAKALITLAESSTTRVQLGEAGRRYAALKQNWESESRKLIALYERLIGPA